MGSIGNIVLATHLLHYQKGASYPSALIVCLLSICQGSHFVRTVAQTVYAPNVAYKIGYSAIRCKVYVRVCLH